MKRNGTGRTRRNGRADFGTKQLIALILALALSLGMLCATAEDSDGLQLPGDATRTNDGELYVGDEAAPGDSGTDLVLPGDATLDEGALVVDAFSLDGLEANLLEDELAELDMTAEDPTITQAANKSDPGDFEIDGNGVLVKYVGKGGDVVIPDEVTRIGKNAFYKCKKLTGVTIPDSVNVIGEYAFGYCSRLKSVTIPDGVVLIRDGVFSGCTELTEVFLPDSLTYIGEQAFYECKKLKDVTIPDGVRGIGKYAFNYCDSLTSLTIPDSVTRIGYGAFDSSGLTKVTIGGGVGTGDLWDSGILSCPTLETIAVTMDNMAYVVEDGVLFTADMKTLVRCPRAKTDVTVPEGVTGIGDYAFSECDKLTSVTLPEGVTGIGDNAFSECDKLTSMTLPEGVTGIGDNAFSECDKLTSVTLPDSVISIGEAAFFNCTSLKEIFIPSSVNEIGSDAFHEEGYDEWYDEVGIVPMDLLIRCCSGSYAHTYAKKNGFAFLTVDKVESLAGAVVYVRKQVYTGKSLKPAVEVRLNGRTLAKGTDYTVSYKNNKAIGIATVTVRGKGDYTGTVKTDFQIRPGKVSGLKLKAGKGLLTASWKKSAGGVSGYQLQYTINENFIGGKTVLLKKGSIVRRTLKDLKKGKTYYVRIRAWKQVGDTICLSDWSEAKNAKVK